MTGTGGRGAANLKRYAAAEPSPNRAQKSAKFKRGICFCKIGGRAER